jgi:predicted RNA-binding Zn-ribbon protein involved in translation (DUF1610 family)
MPEEDMTFFNPEDEMIRLARDTQNRLDMGYVYYCSNCDWYYKTIEVEEQTDGITPTVCPECGTSLQTAEDT